jgi:hypothetical protein
MRVTHVDGTQQRWSGTLSTVAALCVQLPELQRTLDASRVQDIVEYQQGHASRYGHPLFLGDIATLVRDAHGRLWVVDGQHRLAAVRRLVAEYPEHPVSLLVVQDGPGTRMDDVFELVNRAVPVPEWMVTGTIDAAQRCTIRDAERLLRDRYGAFLSNAMRPRRPNINLNALTSALAATAARHPRKFPLSAAGILAFVEYANTRMRDAYGDSQTTRAAAEKALARSITPLFLANEPAFDFVEPWLIDFVTKHQSLVGPVQQVQTASVQNVQSMTSTQKPRHIPKATRTAVWNRFFTARKGVGTCQCCRKEITQQEFECGHVISAANGGAAELANLRPVCRTCNRSMGAASMDDFVREQGLGKPLLSFHIDVDECT